MSPLVHVTLQKIILPIFSNFLRVNQENGVTIDKGLAKLVWGQPLLIMANNCSSALWDLGTGKAKCTP